MNLATVVYHWGTKEALFAALDRSLRLDMQIEIKRIQRSAGTTTLIVTHDQREALALADRVVVVSGPNLAKEVADEQPAATVVACADSGRAVALQRALSTAYFRPYTNSAVVGAEIGGACKNVIALACGMASGKGLGNNTMATIITRGLAEITRLGVELGADPFTFSGLAGMGDLVATCSSTLSRNRTFGAALSAGASLEEAKAALVALMRPERLAEGAAIGRPAAQARICCSIRDETSRLTEITGAVAGSTPRWAEATG